MILIFTELIKCFYCTCRVVDYVTLMAYDYYGSWNKVAGHNAPFSAGHGLPSEHNVVC